MDVAEHVYHDDPSVGPPDVRTTLTGIEYFFLGNGLIQASVQVCTSGEGTPVGLLVLHPNQLLPKRRALTFDAQYGLAPTAVIVQVDGQTYTPQGHALDAHWTTIDGIPAVQITWPAGALRVTETFYCHDRHTPTLTRTIRVDQPAAGDVAATLRTGPDHAPLERALKWGGATTAHATLQYALTSTGSDWHVAARFLDAAPDHAEAAAYWNRRATLDCASPTLDHLYHVARSQMPASVTAAGMMDGGIWQYNLEWVRDQSRVAEAFVYLGDLTLARTMLDRMLTDFVSPDGDCVDSGRRRNPAEAELDQNGYLLAALETYVNWTGDLDILRQHWPRITAAAEFPRREVFRHQPSGLMHNQREYWERHGQHGIQEGMELLQQLYVSIGLAAAARLAQLVDQPRQADRWATESQRIRDAMLTDPRYSSVENGCFIKRRDVSGAHQVTITPTAQSGLPDSVPLAGDEPHYLDPDASSVLPIAEEFIDPHGDLARNTLADVEQLWNQRWTHGGYGRYHVSSEPDSPGPWPFATLFVARACFEAGADDRVWRILDWLCSVPGGRAGAWFEFYGQRPVPPCPQIGIIPWTWAEILSLFIHHMLGVRPTTTDLLLRPRLLANQDRATACLTLRGHTLRLNIRRARPGEQPTLLAAGQSHPYTPSGIRLPLPTKDLDVEVIVPA